MGISDSVLSHWNYLDVIVLKSQVMILVGTLP